MRRLRRSERGLSEIVGTLMLVLIVVAAAAAFAAFVASYQKQLQQEQSFSHDQSLESIHVIGLTTTVSGGAFATFSFTLTSEYVNPSIIQGVSINGNPLLTFAWDNVTTSTTGTYTLGQDFKILPFDQVIITLDLNPAHANTTYSFLSPNAIPLPNHYIKFDVYTYLQNDFTRVFLPPAPLAVVSEINPSGDNPITLLDGSMSFQPGTNASIVNWAWSVGGGGMTSTAASVIGAPTNGTSPWLGSGTANFTVPVGFVWGSGDSIVLKPLSDLTDSGPGCTGVTAATFTAAAAGEVVTGTTLSVPYSYSATDAGCTVAPTFTLATGGLSLTLNASGEEYEISPALSSSAAPYLVTLTVTNSDGLAGTVTVSYTPPT